jgi:hypothetical protein
MGDPRVEDGTVSKPVATGSASPEVQALAGEATRTLQFDREAGWPPKVKGRKDEKPIAPVRFEAALPPRLQRKYVDAARRHPDVDALLHGRCELLGCHLVSHKHRRAHAHCVRVVFANYSENHLVEAHVHDGHVESVVKRPNHAHPEAPIEMAQAIAIAKNDPEIKDEVAKLDAHAILHMPDPQTEYRDHRCLLVAFTEASDAHVERPVLFSALVDLHLQKVIKSGCAPCEL